MKIVAVILAGGQSRRMGQDKALLTIDGIPLLRRIYDVVRDCVPKVYVVTPWPERYRILLPADCGWLQEARPHQGPLAAFQQALSSLTADWIILLACDLPYLQSATIKRWLADLENIPEEAIAYLAPHAKGWEVLCGCYRGNCRLSLDVFVQTGGYSLQKWLHSEQVAAMEGVLAHQFTNWNYPEDID